MKGAACPSGGCVSLCFFLLSGRQEKEDYWPQNRVTNCDFSSILRPMFSLIVPIFNEKEVVEHTIRTLHETLSKNGGDFEIIAVDDGSTDGTAQILSALQLPHVHALIHPQNRGYSSSIKAGMRHAKGGRSP